MIFQRSYWGRIALKRTDGMSTDTETHEGAQSDEWFASAKKIYPMATHGLFRRIKWALLFITLGIYYFLPFIRYDRGPDAPSQAVLVDMEGSRAYFFSSRSGRRKFTTSPVS